MKEAYVVALFGHRDLSAHLTVEERLGFILPDLIAGKPYVEFYIGRDGEFDIFAASVIKQVQKKTWGENNSLTLVLPYVKRDVEYYENYYDSVIIPECAEKVHPKRAIEIRNRWMIEKCDLLICYVDKKSGGAYNAFKYAEKLGKSIINIADERKI